MYPASPKINADPISTAISLYLPFVSSIDGSLSKHEPGILQYSTLWNTEKGRTA